MTVFHHIEKNFKIPIRQRLFSLFTKDFKKGVGGVTFGIQKTPISALKTGNFLTEQSYSSNGITKNQKSILW